MTPDAQNIAIAESLGKTGILRHKRPEHMRRDSAESDFVITVESESGGREELPNYTGSLDACAKFEAALPEEKQSDYAWYLVQICDPFERFSIWKSPNDLAIWEMSLSDCFTCASAKPAQRCEAYLRTIGKWQESN